MGFRIARSKVALSIRAIAVASAILAIYFQDLTIIVNDAVRSDLMSYVLAIPLLFVYLIYRRRKMLKAAILLETTGTNQKSTYTGEIVGSLLCITAFLLYWHGSHTFYPLEYHMISLSLFTAGLTLMMFNVKTLQVLAFPIAFLFFLTPPPTEIISIAGASAATLSSDFSYNILKAIGLPVTQISEYGAPALVVTDPSGSQVSFVVGIASSGIHSIIGFSIFAIFIMYIARGPTWKKTTILIASIPLIYTLTLTRIILLVSIGHWQGVNIAWDIFHLLGASVLIFLAAIILLSLSEKIWKLQIFTTKPKTTPCAVCNPHAKTRQNSCPACGKILKYPRINLSKQDIGKIAALIIATILILTISVPVFALSEGPPEVLVQSPGNEQATTTQIFPKIPNYNLTFVYRDTQFEKIATRDRALVYAYTPTNTSAETIFIVMEIGPSKSTWHSWEASVITWPRMHGHPYGTQLDLREIQLQQNPPLTGKYFAFKQAKTNTTQVVLYWYESALFNTGSSSEQKYVKTSLVAYPKNPHNITETEEMLLPFAKAIVDYWQPIKTWSQISLTIAQNGAPLTTIPTTLLATILIAQIIQKQRNKKANLKIYNQLASPKEKQILQATYEASKKHEPTVNAIASHYKKLTGKTIKIKTLTEKLKQAQKLGLIKKDIASREDEPITIWKSQMPLGKSVDWKARTQN